MLFNLHSIINNGLIPGGQGDKQYSSCLLIQEIKIIKILHIIDFSVPRRARYMQNAWKRHQEAAFWVDIDLAIRKGLTFYQTRSHAIVFQGTLLAYCVPKVRLKIGEVLYEESYMCSSTTTKDLITTPSRE